MGNPRRQLSENELTIKAAYAVLSYETFESLQEALKIFQNLITRLYML